MNRPILFVTGTDTGVGKSVLTAALVDRLQQRGRSVGAAKPFCSGGRGDARALQRRLGDRLSLNEINPWHYARPLAPAIAAAAEPDSPPVRWRDAARHLRHLHAGHSVTVVEGAGGVLSPLTSDGDATHLIRALRAVPLVVCPNRLGAINQALLALQALPAAAARRARLILMAQARPDASAPSNLRYLRTRLGSSRVFAFPRLHPDERQGRGLRPSTVQAVDRVLQGLAGEPAKRARRPRRMG